MQFRIRADSYREIRKQTLLRSIPFLVIVISASMIMIWASPNKKKDENDINTLPFFIPLVAVVLGFGIYRGWKQKKTLLESYALVIENNLITRYQINTPTISLYFADIAEITKDRQGNFTIKGKNKADLIIVPAYIENHSQLEATLHAIKPVAPLTTSVLQKYTPLLSILILGLMVCVYAMNNKIIVALSGSLFIILMLWSLNEIRKNKNVDRRTKRGLLWVLLVLVSVITIMLMKLFK